MKQEFPLNSLPTTDFFGKPVNTSDLGSVTRAMFTSYKRIRIEDLEPRQTEVFGGTINLKIKGKKSEIVERILSM